MLASILLLSACGSKDNSGNSGSIDNSGNSGSIGNSGNSGSIGNSGNSGNSDHVHEWGSPVYTFAVDYSTCTAERVCEKDSSHKETETVSGVYNVLAQSTFDSEGQGKYTYTFTNSAFESQTKEVAIPKYRGEEPRISGDGKTVTYGIYPQSLVTDSAILSSLNKLFFRESNGWFLYDGIYYERIDAAPYKSDYKFENDETIISGDTYWFRCEPITWDVLENSNGEYTLLSSLILDGKKYYDGDISSHPILQDSETNEIYYVSTYKYSDLRYWLINDFYNSAFSFGNTNVLTTAVDNSAETTSDSESAYVKEYDTSDKVFTLSYKDLLNENYGFSSNETRRAKTSDYSRALGISCSSSTYDSGYWTRSPAGNSYSDGDVSIVTMSGVLHPGKEVNELRGVRPAITITIS